MPHLPISTSRGDSIGLSSGNVNRTGEDEGYLGRGSQWEDEEERKFYEELIDLKNLLPKGVAPGGTDAANGGAAASAPEGETDESEEAHLYLNVH